MAILHIDTASVVGKIKPMHGVGKPPMRGLDLSPCRLLEEAGIPFSRLHDVGIEYPGHLVDIPYIFPDFDADPSDPSSYDFTFTDELIKGLYQYHVEPVYRLGVTIENYAYMKSYLIDPPKDNLKWAKICEGIIRHYNEGWANGFEFGIRYWEIWNEPENLKDPKINQMWTGTEEEFFALYGTASRYLKEKFPDIKIGGYGSCGFYELYCDPTNPNVVHQHYYMTFFKNFLAYVKRHNCPLDFFSWHNYNTKSGVKEVLLCQEYVRKTLNEAGFTDTETSLNEWNHAPAKRGTAYHAACSAGILLGCQNSSLDSAMFYDARIGTSQYGGLFNPMNGACLPTYYVFRAFGELYRRKNQLSITLDGHTDGIYAVAAADEAGSGCLMITNVGEKATPLSVSIPGARITSCRLIDDEHLYTEGVLPGLFPKNCTAVLFFEVRK